MAAQRKRRKRRRKKRYSRLGPFFKFLCGIAVVVAITMGATVFFQVEAIEVTGNNRYTQEEIIQATGIQIGDNLFRMNKYDIYNQLYEQLPYLKTVLIRRGLPSTILLTITEWEAMAQILPAVPIATQQETQTEETESTAESPPQYATQPWLISESGMLLEELSTTTTQRMTISGIALADPKAGSRMQVSKEEQIKLDALLLLLSELEAQGMRGDVERIEVGSTQITMGYLARYEVILPLNAEFGYKLRALKTAAQEREQTLGSGITGVFDLTQNYTVVYSSAGFEKKVLER